MAHTNIGRLSGGHSDWRRLVFLAGGLVLWIVWTASRVVGDDSVWRKDFEGSLQKAEEKRLPLLVHFYADWCMPCQRMEREVLPSPSIKEMLGNRFVAVKVNSDKRPDLVRRYGIDSLPSDLVIDSLTGRTIALHAGYQDGSGYIANATHAEAKFIKTHANDLVVTKSIASNEKAIPAVAEKTDPVTLGSPEPVIIGLKGYSPVALTKNKQWIKGSTQLSWTYKDVTYYLSTREELAEFRKNPERFAPKLLGCDPVILWESDRAIVGDIKFGAFFDGELFLFKTDERRQQFKSNPQKYVRLQQALKIDQIDTTVLR